MPGNKRFYERIHYLYAKYTSTCPECGKRINAGDAIVYMSEFQVSLHFDCFYRGPVISWPDRNLSKNGNVVIDPKFNLKTQFMILLYRLKKRSAGKGGERAVITKG